IGRGRRELARGMRSPCHPVLRRPAARCGRPCLPVRAADLARPAALPLVVCRASCKLCLSASIKLMMAGSSSARGGTPTLAGRAPFDQLHYLVGVLILVLVEIELLIGGSFDQCARQLYFLGVDFFMRDFFIERLG